ncbi:unnamed protein product [Cladocopium goreaui]|uniref:Uncharacterized protein n=1 Tax=Cladocopium goreaui TaxID=2562237 RepID=A0A9P1C5Z8_9DINO|nr:unnamed protein product [Cladocopium goreaui]
MTLLVGKSGKLFSMHGCSIKDILVNREVVLATIKGMNGNPRVSAYTLQKAILTVFQDLKLYPAGIYSDIPAVQSWALKYGVAIKKLVSRLRRLMRRSETSKYDKLTEVKRTARSYGWGELAPKSSSGKKVDPCQKIYLFVLKSVFCQKNLWVQHEIQL